MPNTLNGLQRDFTSGIAVHDIVRTILKDNWDSYSADPTASQIIFSDMGYHTNRSYQISTQQLPYIFLKKIGGGSTYSLHIQADVKIHLYVRSVVTRKPKAIQRMMQNVITLINERRREVGRGIQNASIKEDANAMDTILLQETFSEPGIQALSSELKPPTTRARWHTEALCQVFFFYHVTET